MGSSDLEPNKLRRLLAELLRSDPDLDAFVLDYFPDIYQRFSQGMDRVAKENLLLLLAPSRDSLVEALKTRFADSPVWKTDSLMFGAVDRRPASVARRPSSFLKPVLLGAGALGAALIAALLWRFSAPQDRHITCGALSIDDIFLVKQVSSQEPPQLAIDVRLRHQGPGPEPVNITRAAVLLSDKTPERAPYEPSASYDLLIHGERSEAPLAQRLQPGEIDRILIRIGFTRETAAYQYTAKLELRYNGGCTAESKPFPLSWDDARRSLQVAPKERP